MLNRYRRELTTALVLGLLLMVVAIFAPSFYRAENLRDLIVAQAPVLIVAVGMTLVVLVGEIDISVGAQYAIASVAAGALAKLGMPLLLLIPVVALLGALLGAGGGALIAGLKIPSIVVTLAMMVALRDGLRWATEGKWVQNLPADFQWFGLGQMSGQFLIIACALLLFLLFAWGLVNLRAGRAVYATGSDMEAARLASLNPRFVKFSVFVVLGVLTAIAALLNSIRFIEVQGNAGVGLELKTIAAVVVGGTSITGGRGTLIGTLLGVALLGITGTALTYLGINPFWEKAVQGGIILASVASEVLFGRRV